MILLSVMASLLFLGGWSAPLGFEHLTFLPQWLTGLMNTGWIWLGLKTFVLLSVFVWIRGTFPRFRYDQIMRLGWKVFIPVTLVWLVVVGAWIVLLPGISLYRIMLTSQVINGVLLPPILIFMMLIANDINLMGEYANSKLYNIVAWIFTMVLIALTVLLLVSAFVPDIFNILLK